MQVLVIHGSMRKGNTYELTKRVVHCLATKPDVEVTEIGVSELELPLCISCHMCFLKGEEYCPHYNVMQSIEAALLECDGVIVSGTTYVWALNAAMKNVLDHLAFLFHRPALFGRKGMVVTTSAGSGEKSVANYLKTVLGQWGINGAQVLALNAKEREMSAPAKVEAKIEKAAERFYKDIISNKALAPSMKNMAVHNAFRAMSLGEFAASEKDAAYWRQNGFRDKAYPVKVNAFSYFVGATVYGVVKQATVVLGRAYRNRK